MSSTEVRRRGGPTGFAQVPRHLLRDSRICPLGVRIWGILYDMGSDGSPNPFPGQERLAEWAGKSVRSVRAAIAKLREVGYLEVRRRGLGKTNVYTVVWDPTEPCPQPDQAEGPEGQETTHQSGNSCRSGAAHPADKAEPVEAEPVEALVSTSSATSRARGAEPVDDDDDQAQPEQPERVTAADLYADAGIEDQPAGGVPRLVEAVQVERGWQPATLRRVATMASTKRDPRAWLVTVLFDLYHRAAPDPTSPNPLPADLWTDLPGPDDEYWARFPDDQPAGADG